MEPGDIINYPIKDNGIGKGKILDPVAVGLKEDDYSYYQSIGMLLIETIINDKPSYWFWTKPDKVTKVI